MSTRRSASSSNASTAQPVTPPARIASSVPSRPSRITREFECSLSDGVSTPFASLSEPRSSVSPFSDRPSLHDDALSLPDIDAVTPTSATTKTSRAIPSAPVKRTSFIARQASIAEEIPDESDHMLVAKRMKPQADVSSSSRNKEFRKATDPFLSERAGMPPFNDSFQVSRWIPVLSSVHPDCRSPVLMAEFDYPTSFTLNVEHFAHAAAIESFLAFIRWLQSVIAPPDAVAIALEGFPSAFDQAVSSYSSEGADFSLLLGGRLYFHILPRSVFDSASYINAPEWHVYRLGLPRDAVYALMRSLIGKFGLTLSSEASAFLEEDLITLRSGGSPTLLSGSIVTGSGNDKVFSWELFANPYPSSAGSSAWDHQRTKLAANRFALQDTLVGVAPLSDSAGSFPVLDLPAKLTPTSQDACVNFQLHCGFCTSDELHAFRTQPLVRVINGARTRNPDLSKAAITKFSSSASIIYLVHACLAYLLSPLDIPTEKAFPSLVHSQFSHFLKY